MKVLLTTFLLALSGVTCFAQQAISHGPPQAFGPVRTITYQYSSVTFSRDKTRIDEGVSNGRNIVWLLDSKGKPLSQEIFEKDGGSRGNTRIYNYDSSGRLASMIDHLFGKLSFTETFEYPAEGRVKIKRVFESTFKDNTEIETDEYDKAGRIIRATFQNLDGIQTESYKYDDKGNPIEFIAIDRFGKQLIKETYQYEFDKYGNWTERRDKTSASRNLGIPPTSTITRTLTYY